MKKRWIIASALLLAGAVVVVVMWFLDNRKKKEDAPEYVLLYAENQSENYPSTLGGQKFADLVYERTNGRIKIQIKYGAELGSEAEAITQMKYGGIAFARVSVSQLAEKIPDMNVLLLPYLYDDSAHMWRVLEGDIGDDFLHKVEKYDLVGLSWYDAGARNFYSTDKPITCVEDCEGMNIRVQESAIMADMISALGANPVEIVFSDVYSALEQGLVDAAENNWPSYESMNHYKVAGYYTVDEHVRVPEMQICSEAVWNMFSDSDKEIILECAKESAIYERQLWIQREERSKKKAIESGTKVTTLSPSEKKKFRDAMSDVYVKYCGDEMDLINKIIDY
ncbi:TRAP transporter substrate-binding protein [Butyrivibrio sp. X503]|uniref:TRAP transporter substrate-binding protein n=1 Tax=Butyrivibrio sp. X503 TaxID=2364878 RepID=UPI000EAA177B|nr:TRAP transporter substrate-binding protein [Butyrivibrio sp. X503]RKM53911.1 TRAP transporter substrate-binding protein [Butyrivibrio sp. X503]